MKRRSDLLPMFFRCEGGFDSLVAPPPSLYLSRSFLTLMLLLKVFNDCLFIALRIFRFMSKSWA